MKRTMVYDGINAKEIEEWSVGMASMRNYACGVNGANIKEFIEPKMVVCMGPHGDEVAEIGDVIIRPVFEDNKYLTGFRWGVRTQKWIDDNIK